MATLAARLSPVPRVRTIAHARWAPAAALVLLCAGSAALRVIELGAGFWIDEALSIGIADRPLGDIPGVLRRDGSPPLYYLLLHGWIEVVGKTPEQASRALSLLFATLAVPAAWLLARALFGTRAGWAAALLTAFNPFLTQYAQETRMYSLVALLGLAAGAGFVGAFVQMRGRRWQAGFGIAMAALLYTHNWALFFGLSTGLVWLALLARRPAAERRELLVAGLVGYGITVVLYAPWVPSLLFQAANTGAPWARSPNVGQLVGAPGALLGEVQQAVLALGAGAGILAAARAREGRAPAALAALAALTILIAWSVSQLEPAWAVRYLAVALPPLLLLAAFGLARAGRLGVAALALVVVASIGRGAPSEKSNVKEVAEVIDPGLAPGDLVISTQPEQLPALDYYLETPRLRWATLTGGVDDVGVTDWRAGVKRLRAAQPERHLAPLLERIPVGGRVAIVQPFVFDLERWSAPWTALVRLRSHEWLAWLRADSRFRVVAKHPPSPQERGPNPVWATVFLRTSVR